MWLEVTRGLAMKIFRRRMIGRDTGLTHAITLRITNVGRGLERDVSPFGAADRAELVSMPNT